MLCTVGGSVRRILTLYPAVSESWKPLSVVDADSTAHICQWSTWSLVTFSQSELNTSILKIPLRSQSVDTTGLHFQQAVPPVGPWHTEIMDRPPEDLKGSPLQEELGWVCTQANPPAYSLWPLWKTENAILFVSHSHRITHYTVITH